MTPLLVSVALKGLLVLLLAALASRLLRKAPASARHGVWAAAFAALLLLPALAVVGPQWSVGVLPAQVASVAPLAPTPPLPPTPPTPPLPPAPPVPPSPALSAATAADIEAQMAAFEGEMAGFEAEIAAFEQQVEAEVAGEMAAFELEMEAFAAEMEALAAEREAVAASGAEWAALAGTSRGVPPLGRWALALWALGAAVVALSWVGATLAARRIVAQAEPETDAEWGVLAERARRLSGIEGPVRLLRTDALDVPIAWGWGTPAVLLPPDADAWDEGRREAVLLHEMAHLRRRDAWTQVVAQAALAVHWMNPLAWWGYRRFLDAREQACDDAVLQGGARPSDYAAHLVGVARALRREPHALAAVAPMARKACPLEARIRSILDADRRRGHLGRVTRAATVVLAAAVLLPLAALQPVAQTAEAPRVAVAVSAAPAVAPVVAVSPVLAPAVAAAPALAPADTTDEDHDACDHRHDHDLHEAGAHLDAARRELRLRIESMRHERGEAAALRRAALEAAYEGMGEIDVERMEGDMRRAFESAHAALADVDRAKIEAEMARARTLADVALRDIDMDALHDDARRALEEADVALARANAEAWGDVREEALRALDEARREMDREREELRHELRQQAIEAQEEAREERLRELEEARREAARRRAAERDRSDRRQAPRRWSPAPEPGPAPRAPKPEAAPVPRPAPQASYVPGPSAPPAVRALVAPRAPAEPPVLPELRISPDVAGKIVVVRRANC